jgi:hypothetical protein
MVRADRRAIEALYETSYALTWIVVIAGLDPAIHPSELEELL